MCSERQSSERETVQREGEFGGREFSLRENSERQRVKEGGFREKESLKIAHSWERRRRVATERSEM